MFLLLVANGPLIRSFLLCLIALKTMPEQSYAYLLRSMSVGVVHGQVSIGRRPSETFRHFLLCKVGNALLAKMAKDRCSLKGVRVV